MPPSPSEPAQLLDTLATLKVRKVSFELARWRLPVGAEGVYGCIRHPGACLAVPVLDDGRVVVLRQYRFAVARRLLEFPAGTLEAGEQPLASVQRELGEETGFAAARWDSLGRLLPCPGYSDEVIHLFLARQLTPLSDPPGSDPDEDLQVVTLTPDQLEERLAGSEEFLDAKTVTAWFQARAFLTRESRS
ncbi:MAG: NUDIX hydrolase [Candidatus Synechococcus spongiarum 15L]|uniref:NUDIX hydrolase n=1 Tax=Candidatus Synechococcus spongiarum 15L TaxID=1608419 RepID=A0A0G8ASN8_9SYNE|nr:MAG: NUDIX hydrolase [Candidatus Synechococcus spongiarum 15L]